MKITQINVSAGRVISHPIEQYSNLRPIVSLTAVLDDGEDAVAATKQLQAQAEGLVEDHANQLTTHIRDMYMLSEKEREVKNLEASIIASQKRLEGMRAEIPLMMTDGSGDDEPAENSRFGDYSDKSQW